jgi:hypothetical protein
MATRLLSCALPAVGLAAGLYGLVTTGPLTGPWHLVMLLGNGILLGIALATAVAQRQVAAR